MYSNSLLSFWRCGFPSFLYLSLSIDTESLLCAGIAWVIKSPGSESIYLGSKLIFPI